MTQLLAGGLGDADRVLLIATAERREALASALAARGLDVSAASSSGQLTWLEATAALAATLCDGEPDSARFDAVIGKQIEQLVSALVAPARLRIYSELVDLAWREGQRTAALRLEELWHGLLGRYPQDVSYASERGRLLERVQPALEGAAGEGAAPLGDAERPSQVRALAGGSEPLRLLREELAERQQVEEALREALRELRAREQSVRRSEEQLHDFLDNAAIGLHSLSADGTIAWANRHELELLGYDESEYVGRPVADFHADPQAIADILAAMSRGEELHNHEARLRARDGSIKHVLISSSVYRREGRSIHTRCFTRDITERRQAQRELEESHRQLQLITDALPVLVALIGADLRYQFASAGYERWFGLARAEVVGKRMEEVLGSAAHRAIQPYVQRALAGDAVTYEAEVPYRDGGTRWINASYLPQRNADGEVTSFVALVGDITEKRNFERFRAEAARRAERLLKVTAAIAEAVSAEEVFEALVERLAEAVGASSAGLWLVEREQRVARLKRSRGYAAATQQGLAELPLDLSPSMPALDCIRSGEPVWVNSQAALLARYPHLAPLATPGRSYRIACLPLIANRETLGTLAVTIEYGNEQSADERELLLLASRYASQAIARLRLLEAEHQSRREADAAAERLGILSHSSRAFGESSLDFDARLQEIVAELARALDSCVTVTTLDADGLLRMVAMRHPDPEAQASLAELAAVTPIEQGEGITGGIAATGQSVLLPSIDPGGVAARAAGGYREFLERHPAYALIGAALRAGGRVIGTVTATRYRPGQGYGVEDLRLLEELGERAAAAMENSRLYRESLQARRRAEQLYRFAQSVVSAERVEQVFDAALAAIEASLGVERAAILLRDTEGVMRFRAWRKLSDGYRAAVEGHSPWPADATHPEPVLAPDVERAPGLESYRSLFRAEGIGALAFLPLATGGRLLGKLVVYHAQPHVFSDTELETARAVSNHLASVVTRFAVISKLEETVRYNELFAGILAHDLRNPLNAMTTAAQLVLMQREGEAARSEREAKPLSRILASGQRMATMIEQLLDFTRARSGGGIVVEPQAVNLADLCAQAVGEIELAYPERPIQQRLVGDPSGTWDGGRLLQVLSNLIANACQHGTPETPVWVRIDGREPRQVTIEVHNQGAIPPPLLGELFDPFRSTRHQRQRSRGLGLGLFIVREIVRAHGGTVGVTSTAAEGTTFAIQLPRS